MYSLLWLVVVFLCKIWPVLCQNGIVSLSASSITLPNPCAGATLCDITYSICIIPPGSIDCQSSLQGVGEVPAGQETFTVTDRDAFAIDTITFPSTVTYDVLISYTVVNTGIQEVISGTTTQTINKPGSTDVTLAIDGPDATQATIVMKAVSLCDAGYYGDTCSVACTPSADAANGFYYCDSNGNKVCQEGFTGSECKTDVDECASSPCLNGGTCVNTVGSFMCTCVTGCSGNTCSTGASSTTRSIDTIGLLAANLCVDAVRSIDFSSSLAITFNFCGDNGVACVNRLVTAYAQIYNNLCAHDDGDSETEIETEK